MKECWQCDCHHRPPFKSIIDRLDMVANFPDESFHLMQEKWQEEIRDRLEEIRVKEQELHILEVDLVKTQREQKMKEELVKQREA